jgi:hypothetical protein
MLKSCDSCGGSGTVKEVARYRVPPPGDVVWDKGAYRPARDSVLVEETRVRSCIRCGGTGEVQA